MLAHLKVRDLVLIDELDLEFSPGFNVLTGATGAGKSLVVTALDLLLGRRGQSGLVRRGANEAEIEGLFDIDDEPEVKCRLKDAGLPVHDELLVRRIIPAKGRHRCYINGKLASLGVLSSLADGLASVMSQHEHHALLDPPQQLALLDGFGRFEVRIGAMGKAYNALRECELRLSNLKQKEKDRSGRLDYLHFQLKEIRDLAPSPNELETLDKEIELLRHQEVLQNTTRHAADELYECDRSIYERLGSLCNDLESIARFDKTLEDDARQLAEATVLVEETARSLSSYGRDRDTDPNNLENMEERREQLRHLTRKHGTDLPGVIALSDELTVEIETLEKYKDSLTSLETSVKELTDHALKHAETLTKERRKAAVKLSKAVTAELIGLSFERAEFKVNIVTDKTTITASGIDTVEFTVALNPGEGVHPLRKVASGGELSRMMLGIRRVLVGVGPVGTYVFDEVDAGISGAVAMAVGKRLRETATGHQVICITHLPQISALAETHFHVSKQEQNGRTTSKVVRLNAEERINEVAKMLGGNHITPGIKAAAKDLFKT